MMTKQQRVNAAIKRMEDSATSLIYRVENYPEDGHHNKLCARRDVLEAARQYAAAVQRVTRVRK